MTGPQWSTRGFVVESSGDVVFATGSRPSDVRDEYAGDRTASTGEQLMCDGTRHRLDRLESHDEQHEETINRQCDRIADLESEVDAKEDRINTLEAENEALRERPTAVEDRMDDESTENV